jgi:hypothetical protein
MKSISVKLPNRPFTRISNAWCFGQGSMMPSAAMHLAGSIDRNEIVIYPDEWHCNGTDGPSACEPRLLNVPFFRYQTAYRMLLEFAGSLSMISAKLYTSTRI